MDRRDFLIKSVTGVAVLGAAYCIGGCSSPTAASAPSNVDFTIDLSDSANAALLNAGGSLSKNGLIIINAGSNTYRAFSQACTHEGTAVQYQSGLLYCPNHGSEFSATTGAVIRSPASSPLKQYTVATTGTKLHITG